MNEKKLPIAWLPADKFENPDETRFLDLFTELVATGISFSTRFLCKPKGDYELVVEATITQSLGGGGKVDILLIPGTNYKNLENAKELNDRNYKTDDSHPGFWKRTMPGTPAPNMVANHLFSGIKHLVGFDTAMNFAVSSDTRQGQPILDSIIGKRDLKVDRDWQMILL